MPKSSRLRSEKRLKKARQMGCCICGKYADAHHLRIVGHARAAALKNGDDYTIPLCRLHHEELHSFGDEELFLDFHGIDWQNLLIKLNEGNDD